MTKTVRVENADTANYNVHVEVWEKSIDGGKDNLVDSFDLPNPTAMKEFTLWDGRYLKITENSTI